MAQPLESAGLTASWIFQGMAGGAVGVGMMIIFLAKWGKKLFGGEQGETGERGARGLSSCPYQSDHPRVNEFITSSEEDRHNVWVKLGDISNSVARMDGKLELLLRGARVRWNNGLIPSPRERGEHDE